VIILGIDPGSVKTGYGLIESKGRDLRVLDAGVIRTRSGEAFCHRLVKIHSGLEAVIREYEPEVAAVETTFIGARARNIQSILKLSHARGVALLAVASAGMGLVEYAPADVKKSIAGHGRADKGQMKKMVQILLGMKETVAEDAADALALAVCHSFRKDPLPVKAGAGYRRRS
jgi:crossover junction endodeoxyribonuclease RuvC